MVFGRRVRQLDMSVKISIGYAEERLEREKPHKDLI